MTPLAGVLFTFPSRYWSTIGRRRVFSLARWSSQIPTGFPVSRGTRDSRPPRQPFAYRPITFYGVSFQRASTRHPRFTSGPTTPAPSEESPGLGCFPFARRYSGNRGFFLFLRVLRWFTSPGSLPPPMDSGTDDRGLPRPGSPIRTPPDQSLLAASRGFSQLAASFIAFLRQGIHRPPLVA